MGTFLHPTPLSSPLLCSSPLVMIGCPPTALGSVLGINEKHEAAVTCNVTALLDSNMTTILFIARTGGVL